MSRIAAALVGSMAGRAAGSRRSVEPVQKLVLAVRGDVEVGKVHEGL